MIDDCWRLSLLSLNWIVSARVSLLDAACSAYLWSFLPSSCPTRRLSASHRVWLRCPQPCTRTCGQPLLWCFALVCTLKTAGRGSFERFERGGYRRRTSGRGTSWSDCFRSHFLKETTFSNLSDTCLGHHMFAAIVSRFAISALRKSTMAFCRYLPLCQDSLETSSFKIYNTDNQF